MMDSIKELSSLSQQLNERSDQLNPIISSVNEKLAKLNLGVEAWLYDDPIEQGEAYFSQVTLPTDTFFCVDNVVFGYCRVGEKWELALKSVTYQRSDAEYAPEPERVDKHHSKSSLLKASRSARIQALTLLPKLLDLIKEQAEKMLEGIDNAKNVAAKL